ncbi:MAG: hypothetical protein Ct9H300mP27_02980 [Chloroflexota bacterium]|nr:MAG: hypothetical protein Ct9H300mP27_02980 [Chloroflexota bacterium]
MPPFLETELLLLTNVKVVLALGKIAFDPFPFRTWADLERMLGLRGRGLVMVLNMTSPWTGLMGSYHPSQQNTQTVG